MVIISTFILMACDNGNTDPNENKSTSLRIRNESFADLTEVIWNNVSYVANEASIKTGTNVTKSVEPGIGYIFFKKVGSSIPVRTNALITVEENRQNIFIFTNNTLITDVANIGKTGTLETFFTGPGGGIIFFSQSKLYVELSNEDFGAFTWSDAMLTAQNYKGGGFNNWRLPDIDELDLLYRNLFLNGLGDFTGSYWSAVEDSSNFAYWQSFNTSGSISISGDYYYSANWSPGSQMLGPKTLEHKVRTVRSFELP